MTKSLDDLLDEADALKARLDQLRPLPADVEGQVLQKLRMLWNYHSNAIEGNKYSLGETQSVIMHGLTAKGKPIKDYLDIAGHNEAIAYLLGLVRQNERLTEAALRKLHEILLIKEYEVEAITPDGKPTKKVIQLGKYKTEPNHVVTVTGETHYYAAPEDVPALMGELFDWYREELDKPSIHPIRFAAQCHHRFTHIHPFDDGNGRLSRLLMNLILMQRGYPPAIFQIADRDQYLAALQHADAGDLSELARLLADAVSLSLQIYLKAAAGEQIHELLDVSRDVALLKQSLMHIQDPVELSPAVQAELISSSIVPLVQKFLSMLQDILDLFRAHEFSGVFSFIMQQSMRSKNLEFEADTFSVALFEPIVGSDVIVQELTLTFTLRGFKRAGVDSFDLARTMRFFFEPLSFRFLSEDTDKRFLYEPFDVDTINEISGALMRWFLREIRSRMKLQL
jgi:Fic family protein